MKTKDLPVFKQKILDMLPVTQADMWKKLDIGSREGSHIVNIMLKERLLTRVRKDGSFLLEKFIGDESGNIDNLNKDTNVDIKKKEEEAEHKKKEEAEHKKKEEAEHKKKEEAEHKKKEEAEHIAEPKKKEETEEEAEPKKKEEVEEEAEPKKKVSKKKEPKKEEVAEEIAESKKKEPKKEEVAEEVAESKKKEPKKEEVAESKKEEVAESKKVEAEPKKEEAEPKKESKKEKEEVAESKKKEAEPKKEEAEPKKKEAEPKKKEEAQPKKKEEAQPKKKEEDINVLKQKLLDILPILQADVWKRLDADCNCLELIDIMVQENLITRTQNGRTFLLEKAHADSRKHRIKADVSITQSDRYVEKKTPKDANDLRKIILDMLPIAPSDLLEKLDVSNRVCSNAINAMIKENLITRTEEKGSFLLEKVDNSVKKSNIDHGALVSSKSRFAPCCGCELECDAADCALLTEWLLE